MDVPPNQTIYLNNLNDSVQKEGVVSMHVQARRAARVLSARVRVAHHWSVVFPSHARRHCNPFPFRSFNTTTQTCAGRYTASAPSLGPSWMWSQGKQNGRAARPLSSSG